LPRVALVTRWRARASRVAIGDLRHVEHFNDHPHEGRDRVHSDYGLTRALVLLR
jgi:hypothetical protein